MDVVDEDNQNLYGVFIGNTLVSIIIILVIICAAPLIGYGITAAFIWRKEDDYSLVKNFTSIHNGLDAPYNTFENMFLFCSYIPYKKLRMCKSGTDQEKILYNYYLYKINEIRKKIFDLKTFCDGDSYNSIKDASDKAIVKNKAERINREHSEKMVDMKESGKNNRAAWKRNLDWAKQISSWFHSFIEFIFRVWDYIIKFVNMFIPVLKAIFSNQVITGYMVIIITIYLIIYGIKKALEPPKEEEVEKDEDVEEEGFLSSMYREYLDTLSYYNKLMKNVRVKDYTGGVLGGASNEEGGDDDTVIDRPIVNGKMYDNLSYLVLSDLLSDTEQKQFLRTNIENGKYYNIYLPEEKYVNDYDPTIESVIKWKVSASNKNKNEKTWNLDCEAIDTIKKGTVDTGIPVFISDANKCIINEGGLNDLFINEATTMQETIYKTEYIK